MISKVCASSVTEAPPWAVFPSLAPEPALATVVVNPVAPLSASAVIAKGALFSKVTVSPLTDTFTNASEASTAVLIAEAITSALSSVVLATGPMAVLPAITGSVSK